MIEKIPPSFTLVKAFKSTWQMCSPDDASLHEMKNSLYALIVLLPIKKKKKKKKKKKNTMSKDCFNSFPVLPKHEKFCLQFWSGHALYGIVSSKIESSN